MPRNSEINIENLLTYPDEKLSIDARLIKNYFIKLIRCLPNNIYWLDKNCRTLGCNDNTLKFVGLKSLDDFINLSYEEMKIIAGWTTEQAMSFKNDDLEVMRSGKPIINKEEPVFHDKEGKELHYISSRYPIFNEKNEVIGIVGNSIDIATRKENERLKLESERQEAERLRLENEMYKKILYQQEKFTNLAFQVAHDIASPTAALSMLVNACDDIPEEARLLLKETATRINDIAHNLLNQYKIKNNDNIDIDEKPQAILLSAAILQLLTEKRLQYASLPINFNHTFDNNHFIFIHTQPSALKRCLSNLLNNAIEACEEKAGTITVSLSHSNNRTKISINDNGKGMPPKTIKKILHASAINTDKKEGHGIGLTQVYECLKQNKGELEIESKLGEGTTITLSFPYQEPPEWLCKEIKINNNDTIIILDDDKPIHYAWNSRLEAIIKTAPDIQIKHFEIASETLAFLKKNNTNNNIVLLTDYELLKQDLNGLDIIEQSKIERAILVTSHYTSKDIQERALNLNTKILPKQLASEVQLKIEKQELRDF